MGPPKCFCMFSSKFVVLKKILGFSTFVVAEIFWVKNWKILAFSKNPIFQVQNFFFETKHFWSWKIGFLEKAKISKFFNFWPKIFQQQQMLKTLKLFSELQIYWKTCKNILVDPSWIKISSEKFQGEGKRPFPQRVTVVVKFIAPPVELKKNFSDGLARISTFSAQSKKFLRRVSRFWVRRGGAINLTTTVKCDLREIGIKWNVSSLKKKVNWHSIFN